MGGDPGRSALDGVERGLPALSRAMEITRAAARVGFDWPDVAPVWDKIQEEIREIQEALSRGEGRARVEAEVGDLLMAVANLSRFLGVDPQAALEGAIDRFEARFRGMERELASRGERMEDQELDYLEELWVAQKRSEVPP